MGRPQRRDASRTWALVNPASSSGVIAPARQPRMPGRKPAAPSSALVPVATVANPSYAASGAMTSSSSALQK